MVPLVPENVNDNLFLISYKVIIADWAINQELYLLLAFSVSS